jgi:hypothetical protein
MGVSIAFIGPYIVPMNPKLTFFVKFPKGSLVLSTSYAGSNPFSINKTLGPANAFTFLFIGSFKKFLPSILIVAVFFLIFFRVLF